MKDYGRLILAVYLGLLSTTTFSFGVDYCFTSEKTIQNCIPLGESPCRKEPTDEEANEVTCRIAATANSLSGLSGTNTVVGGRNSVHTDSTYIMAQLIGFSPWQAYQMAIYSEATDQAQYIPFNQNFEQMLTSDQISECNTTWGKPTMPYRCLVMTPYLSGIYKFNSSTGGMLLHLHARYSPDGNKPSELSYPITYLSEEEAPYEKLLKNLRDWVFDVRYDACAAGITRLNATPDASFIPCESTSKVLNSPISFFALGFSRLAIPFVTNLGTLIINERDRKSVV